MTYEHFADRDALTGVVLERMLAGVSTRRYARTQEPVGADVERASRSTSKSAVSRTFVERTSERLGELMARRLDDVRLAVLMLDGIDLKGRCNVVALGVTTEGVRPRARRPERRPPPRTQTAVPRTYPTTSIYGHPEHRRAAAAAAGECVIRLLRTLYGGDGQPIQVSDHRLAGDKHVLLYDVPADQRPADTA